MKYPTVTIKIKDYRPSLVYSADSDTNRTMHDYEFNTANLLEEVVSEFNLVKELEGEGIERSDMLFNLAERGDEIEAPDFPKAGTPKETDIKNSLDTYLQILQKSNSDMMDQIKDLDEPVKNELIRNMELDMLAALLNYIHFMFIAHALLFASDLGLGLLSLEDDSHNIQLRARLARSAEEFKFEMQIVE